jgi:hypothetical protein
VRRGSALFPSRRIDQSSSSSSQNYKTFIFFPPNLKDIDRRVFQLARWFVESKESRASVKAATAGREGRRKALSATGFQGIRLTWLRRS